MTGQQNNRREIRAHAKINLSLDIVGRREDGYHFVRMVMQSLALHDTLLLETCADPGVWLTTDRRELAVDDSNLVHRAAARLLQMYCPGQGVRIHLEKRIPLSAGLAGGSTDAAAALRGMNDLFSLGLTEEALARLGVQLGADIPFCLCGGTALSEGIGEILTALPALPPCHILLAKPEKGMSTAEAYKAFDAETEVRHPDTDGQIRALQSGDLAGVAAALGNVLEPVTEVQYPEVESIRQCMLREGALGARMSGSGPTVFGIFTEAEKAEKACSVLKKKLSGEVILTAPNQNGRNA
ncbi:MAG: 4-(cytidine 5'-diphospho)-2-C-methyl-D-erythritol kinase [Eubacterium sp.]|nr:4-(cytidine 5'-diphospho)-2-C-methyl-D-erythritol kinase [Eubacterium sp.]